MTFSDILSMFVSLIARVWHDEEGGGEGGGEGGEGGSQNVPELPEGAIMADQWFSALPEELQNAPELQKFKDGKLEDFARSVSGFQKLVGKDPNKLVEMPDSPDSENRREILQRLGLPETTKDGAYKLEAPEGTPEFLQGDSEFSQKMIDKAHELGVFPDQLAGLYNTFVQEINGAYENQTSQLAAKAEENARSLEAEFGAAFNGKIAAANFAIDKLGGEEVRDALNEAGLGTHPPLIKALAEIGNMLAEDGDVSVNSGTGRFGNEMTPNEAKAKGRELLEEAMNTNDMAKKKRLNDEAQKFFKMASGA